MFRAAAKVVARDRAAGVETVTTGIDPSLLEKILQNLFGISTTQPSPPFLRSYFGITIPARGVLPPKYFAPVNLPIATVPTVTDSQGFSQIHRKDA